MKYIKKETHGVSTSNVRVQLRDNDLKKIFLAFFSWIWKFIGYNFLKKSFSNLLGKFGC